MEEIKIWKVNTTNKNQPFAEDIVHIAETTTEKLLEDILTNSPDLLLPNLKLIGRQTETSGGPLDLLGVDEDGKLVVFELKRGTLTRDAVAQAIDYASYLESIEPEALCDHVNDNSGNGGTENISDFSEWYKNHFQRDVSEIGKPRIILVGLGVDERAKRMVAFLSDCDLDISLITFHGFQNGDETLLARQVDISPKTTSKSVKSTKIDNLNKLNSLLNNLSCQDEYNSLATLLKSSLSSSVYQWPNPAGYSYYLPETTVNGTPTNRSYIALYVNEKQKGKIQVFLQPRAVDSLGEEFIKISKIEHGFDLTLKSNGCAEIWLHTKDNEANRKIIKLLCEKIKNSWQSQSGD